MGTLYKKQNGVFKHTHQFTGYLGSSPYLKYKDGSGVIDNVGRQHINLYGLCDICHEWVFIANIHVNKEGKLYGLNNTCPDGNIK